MRLLLAICLLVALAVAEPTLIARKAVFGTRSLQPTVGSEMIVSIDIFNAGDEYVPFLSYGVKEGHCVNGAHRRNGSCRGADLLLRAAP